MTEMSGQRRLGILAGLVVSLLLLKLVLTGTSDLPTRRGLIIVDMHIHTTESDGDRTAEDQIRMASRDGLLSVWITDHDLIRELPRTKELQRFAEKLGMTVGFGVEITVDFASKEHHLLGYFPDKVWAGPTLTPAMVALKAACAEVKSSRETRNKKLVAYLNEILSSPSGSVYFQDPARQKAMRPLVVAEVATWSTANANLMEPTSLGRPHFRAYLMKVVGVRDELIFGPRSGDGRATILAGTGEVLFEGREGKAGQEVEALMHSASLARRDIAFEPLPIVAAIKLINAAGGRAVLAHLPTLGDDWHAKFAGKIAELAREGLFGLEAYSSEISEENHLLIHALAEQHGLAMTGGSDNHGELKVYAKLGMMHRAGAAEYVRLEDWARAGALTENQIRVHQQDFSY